jgi:uncharacterized protein (TIGR03067 family)
LGLTLYLLHKPAQAPGEPSCISSRAGGVWAFFRDRPVWLLPPLFVLWVNLDSWFFLGPVTVGCYLLGEFIQARFFPVREGPDVREPGRVGTLAKVFGVGVLACLISPFHYHGLNLPWAPSYQLVKTTDWLSDTVGISIELPDQLVGAGRTLQVLSEQEPGPFSLPPSPVAPAYFKNPEGGLNVAGISYGVLLAASLGSFVFYPGAWPWGRFLVWLVFAAFSLLQSHYIPFFAVVAGPIAALQFQDLVARRFGTAVRVDGGWKLWSLGGRVATVLAGLALVVLAWPGLLNARPDNPRETRHVGWYVEADPLLRQTARQLNRLVDAGRPPHLFNFDVQLASYCAWFSPGVKTYFDSRFELFRDRVDSVLVLRQSLADPKAEGTCGPLWRREGLGYVVLGRVDMDSAMESLRLGSLSPNRGVAALVRMWTNGGRWFQPDVGEMSTIFARRGPAEEEKSGHPGPRTLNLSRLAYGLKTPDRAPDSGPAEEPQRKTFLRRFSQAPAPSPGEAQQADLYLARHTFFLSPFWQRNLIWAHLTAPPNLLAMGQGGGAAQASAWVFFSTRFSVWSNFYMPLGQREVPQTALLPAVRAARRAIATNPLDAASYLALGKAYLFLWKNYEEQWAMRGQGSAMSFMTLENAHRQILREVQMVAALKRALTLDPSRAEAHEILYQVFFQIHYLDAAADHLGAWIQLYRAHPPKRGPREKAESFQGRQDSYRKILKELDKKLKDLRQEVVRRGKDFKRQSLNQPLHRKVSIALVEVYGQGRVKDNLGRGLANTALDLLRKAKGKEKDPLIAVQQIQLLLTLGQVQEAQEGVRDLEDALRRINLQKKPSRAMLMAKGELEYKIPWCQMQIAAANGNYLEADAAVAKMAGNKRLAAFHKTLLFEEPYHAIRLLHDSSLAYLLNQNRIIRQPFTPYLQNAVRGRMKIIADYLRIRADFDLLRALLALEHGETEKAATFLAKSLRQSKHLTTSPRPNRITDYNDGLIAKNYLQLIELEMLRGTWKARAAAIDGRKAPAWRKDDRWSRLAFQGNYFEAPSTWGTYTIDLLGKPRKMNLSVLGGPGKGGIIPCLFALAGDRLKVSFYARQPGEQVPPVRAASTLGLLLASPGANPATAATLLASPLLPKRPSSFKEKPYARQVVIEYQREKD